MRNLVLRWIIATAALLVAVSVVPGIHFTGEPIELFLVAAVFGLINALLKPLVTLLTCPLVLLTLGLFWLFCFSRLAWRSTCTSSGRHN